jgi:hypothetical protein
MSTSIFEAADVIAAKAKCKNEPWMFVDIPKTKKNKNEAQPTYYIPISAKNVAGKRIPLMLRFASQVIASSAKIPWGVNEKDAMHVTVAYRKLSDNDFESTEYEENKRPALIEKNHQFIEALNIIADSYLQLVESDVLPYRGDKFKLNKVRTINCYRQTKRKATADEQGDEDGEMPMENPFFRIKIGADGLTKRIGFSSEKTGHVDTVFDLKRFIQQKEAATAAGDKKQVKHVVAKLKTTDGYVNLTVTNIKHFVTYMSLTGGIIQFDSVCISKSGISLMCKFKELYVFKHKTLKIDTMNDDAAADMAGFGAGTNNEDDEEAVDLDAEDTESKSKGKSKFSKSGSNKNSNRKSFMKALNNDDEPNDEDDTASNQSGKSNNSDNKKSKQKSKQPAKQAPPAKKEKAKPTKKVVSEEESVSGSDNDNESVHSDNADDDANDNAADDYVEVVAAPTPKAKAVAKESVPAKTTKTVVKPKK